MKEISKEIFEIVNKPGRVGALSIADKQGQPNAAIKTGDGNTIIPFRTKNPKKVYTGKGDLGRCNLLSGERKMKDADQVEASGDIDELNSVLGVLVSVLPQRALWLSTEIERIQMSLFQIGALISTDPNSSSLKRLKSISSCIGPVLQFLAEC